MIKSGKNKLALAIVGAAALAVAGLGTAGIKNTRHNLGSSAASNGPDNNRTDATGEICVFCHTPHGADNAAAVPLWNRALESDAANTYTTYDQLGTSSLDGGVVAVGSVSIACLSCHDGQQAMDVMINEPGSGTDTISAGTWSGSTSDGLTGGDTMNDANFGITFIGTDLTNDHPIGIQYAGGGESGSRGDGEGTVSNYADTDFKPAWKGTVNNMPIWWVPTVAATGSSDIGDVDGNGGTKASGASRTAGTAPTSRNKTDMQLYTRLLVSQGGGIFDSGTDGAADAEPYVECASCHDPHTENATFLRVDNFGSGVCLACHTK
ncbi:cytochrome c3 family protein [Motiliproteus sediminis]|uniref:cytochrome c3 family protein n=1 Tax=Motiliproteus sediminis TaxID=1468178 RepID=UPI001AEF770E|nr:cytochrome c3 family protein [Motiliproteus sediminis]